MSSRSTSSRRFARLNDYDTNIFMPADVKLETEEVTQPDGATSLRAWILETFEVGTVDTSLKEVDVKNKFMEKLAIARVRDVRTPMVSAGVVLGGDDGRGKRFCRYKFGETSLPMKLRN